MIQMTMRLLSCCVVVVVSLLLLLLLFLQEVMCFKRSNITTALRARWMTGDNLKEWHEGTCSLLRHSNSAPFEFCMSVVREIPHYELSLIFRCAAAGWERHAIELGQGYYCDTEFEREVMGPNNTKYKVKTKFVYYPGQAIYSGNSDESSVNDADEATGRSNIAWDQSLGPAPAKPKKSGQHWTLNAGMLLGGFELAPGADPKTAKFVKPMAMPWQVRVVGARCDACC
jgi:hypothetical protein